MPMTTQNPITEFKNNVIEPQSFYGLFDDNAQEWLIVDANGSEGFDALPLFSTPEIAAAQLSGEWQDFSVSEITVDDWLEFWMDDLNGADIVIGIDWGKTDDVIEVSLNEFTQAIMSIEKLTK